MSRRTHVNQISSREEDRETRLLQVAEFTVDSAAMNSAILSNDYDEARFRARLIVANGAMFGHHGVALAAAFLLDRLGAPGCLPSSGFAVGMLRVAEALDAISPEPA